MRKVSYLAVFEETNTGYSVFFPDLPGCISCGKDFEDSKVQAEDALGLHIYGMEKDGEVLPAASTAKDLKDEIESNIISIITVFPEIVKNEIDNRAVKTNVTIPAWLKEIAEINKVNYSKLLQATLIEYLNIRKRQV